MSEKNASNQLVELPNSTEEFTKQFGALGILIKITQNINEVQPPYDTLIILMDGPFESFKRVTGQLHEMFLLSGNSKISDDGKEIAFNIGLPEAFFPFMPFWREMTNHPAVTGQASTAEIAGRIAPHIVISANVMLADILKDKAGKIIYFSSRTPWWTDDPNDLTEVSQFLGRIFQLPLDPLHAPLYQTDDVSKFVKDAMENRDHYGNGQLNTFMAAHHKNSFPKDPKKAQEDGVMLCATSWKQYDEAVERQKIDLTGPLDAIINLL